jgi:hypothetical protein
VSKEASDQAEVDSAHVTRDSYAGSSRRDEDPYGGRSRRDDDRRRSPR